MCISRDTTSPTTFLIRYLQNGGKFLAVVVYARDTRRLFSKTFITLLERSWEEAKWTNALRLTIAH